jgi:hypothetical protein
MRTQYNSIKRTTDTNQPKSMSDSYHLTQVELSLIHDRLSALHDVAEDPDAKNIDVVKSIKSLENEMQRLLPRSRWIDVERDFNEVLAYFDEYDPGVERRKTSIEKFDGQLYKKLHHGNIDIEPK